MRAGATGMQQGAAGPSALIELFQGGNSAAGLPLALDSERFGERYDTESKKGGGIIRHQEQVHLDKPILMDLFNLN